MPMIDHRSVAQLLSHNLLHDAALQAIVGDRVHGGWARDTDLATITKPAVGFVLDGGFTHYEGVYAEFGVELWMVSADSMDQATQLQTLVYDVVQAECLTVPKLDHRGQLFEADAGRGGWFADAACWLIQSRWLFRVARTTIGAVT